MKDIRSNLSTQVCGHRGRAYPLVIRQAALRDYLGGMSACAVSLKYGLTDASVLSVWKRKFADAAHLGAAVTMVKRRNKRLLATDMESAQALRIKELERALETTQAALRTSEAALEDARLQAHISDTFIEIAEQEYGIAIRKKVGSK
jgi:transposase-like protein